MSRRVCPVCHRYVPRTGACNAHERDVRIAALTRAGHTARQIASIVGVDKRTVTRARVRTGTARPCGTPLSDDEIRRAAELLDDGASYGEVARTLGRTTDIISKKLPGRSIFKRGGGHEIRWMMAELERLR